MAKNDDMEARIARLEGIAGLKRTPIREPGKRSEKLSVEDRARAKLREYLEPDELADFEKAAAELDALKATLYDTKDKEAAHDLAYRLVGDTSALYAMEIPLLEAIQDGVKSKWQDTRNQLDAAGVLKMEAKQEHKDIMAEQPKLPPPHPSQSREERHAQIEPTVSAYSERRRKSRATMMATMKQINADNKDLKKQDKELHIEHGRLKSIIQGLKGLPDIQFPLPPPKRAALHDPSKPVFIPEMSPSEKLHATGEYFADKWVKGMDDAPKA